MKRLSSAVAIMVMWVWPIALLLGVTVEYVKVAGRVNRLEERVVALERGRKGAENRPETTGDCGSNVVGGDNVVTVTCTGGAGK